METARKITILIPNNLLKKAQAATGEGITPTIRQGLELVAAGKAYAELRYGKGDFPVSEYLANHELSLPMYAEMTDKQIQTVITSVRDFFAEKK